MAALCGAGAMATVAGCGGSECGASGSACVYAGTGKLELNGDGLDRLATSFYWPLDLEFAPDRAAWVLDWNNHRVRRLDPVTDTFKTIVGDFIGDGPRDQSDLVAPGAPGETVSLNHPTDLQFNDDGTVMLAAWHNHKLRHIDADGLVLVLCGRGSGFAGDGGDASKALFNQPKAIVRAPDGSTFVLDQRNQRIRKITGGGAPTISTVVGVGTAGFAGDGGPPLAAQLNFEAGGNPEPSGAIALGSDGALYISDGLNSRIRKVDFAANTITTIAGTGVAGFSGDGGAAVDAQINNARDLEFGPDGRLYLADTENHRVRAIVLATGIITTVVGTGVQGNKLGATGAKVELNRPFGIAFDQAGDLYVADTFNSRILKVVK
jgi:hypothetical protein